MRKQIGNFEVHVWRGGYPVWCEIEHEHGKFKFSHKELSDLKYAIEEMMKAARNELPDNYKNEV